MPQKLHRIREQLKAFELRRLLIEDLGWDRYTAPPLVVKVGQEEFVLPPIAEKRGMVVFLHEASEIPPYPTRKKIEHETRKSAHEHLIIFIDSAHTTQIWQWVKREPGGRMLTRSHAYRKDQSGQAMAERLRRLVFELEEEENLTLTDVTARTRLALDVEKITKRFYDRFRKEHQVFLKFIEGIEERTDRDWYASLMLNRMMFVYFIQKRGFLDADHDYLRNRLQMVQQRRGKNHFLSFYRCFLLRLFHEGLGEPETSRPKDLNALLGHVPYLNGGLFDVHELERQYGQIDIPDKAFERIFDFFDAYTWHLDERPLRADNEINPDVLGYIFEKYINQKEMGAYYTKEDITGYITRNTVIPYLVEAAGKECAIAFKPEGGVWRLLCENPDRYIYPAVQSGVIDSEGHTIQEDILPDFVQEGMHDPKKRMFKKQYNLTQAVIPGPDGENLALPTETWREYVERRKRCIELREKLARGEVQAINDLITLNLDIEQFAGDVITHSEGPELVRAFWKALTNISILDPTCGSGAFLFAALNILEPLYNACLDGMQGFLDDLEASPRKHSPKKLSNFREVLDEMEKHPNRRYFVLKTIVISNLYGVDIMDEAVEICKLRLFLKLVAQVESVKQIEPLPDIDFNIRAGNTLVGFTSLDAVREAITYETCGQHRMLYPEEEERLKRIEEDAENANRAFQMFREQQTRHDMTPQHFADSKLELRNRLAALREELDRLLAKEYGIKTASSKRGQSPTSGDGSSTFHAWRQSHKPFHWLVEFYGIMQKGGFDTVIGNPPYVEYAKVKRDYTVRGYMTEQCGNLYAYVVERCLDILLYTGRIGMIVQLPIVCTDRMKPLQLQCLDQTSRVWFASFDDRPARLFDGLEHIRAVVFAGQKGTPTEDHVFSTTYNRWYSECRPHLFSILAYTGISAYVRDGAIPKIGHPVEATFMNRISGVTPLGTYLSSRAENRGVPAYFHNAPQYWVRAMDFAPHFWNERDGEQTSTQVKTILLPSKHEAQLVVAALNSSLFYWWFILLSDCRHLNMREIESFPIGLNMMKATIKSRLSDLSRDLMKDLNRHKKRKECQYKATGKVVYDEFYPKHSKPIIDGIDRVLAKHYGLTDEELDFIVNYDIKFRMGLNASGESEEESGDDGEENGEN